MHGGDPRVKVQRNIKLPGRYRNPKYPGEIDVLLTSAMLGYPVTHAIECKNLKGKVGKGNIQSFIGKLEDVNIPHQHGIYISAKGYTKDAIDRASTTGIKLLTMTGLTPDGLASVTHGVIQFFGVIQLYCRLAASAGSAPEAGMLGTLDPITGVEETLPVTPLRLSSPPDPYKLPELFSRGSGVWLMKFEESARERGASETVNLIGTANDRCEVLNGQAAYSH